MTHDVIALIEHYGLVLVFLNVLVDQAGAPIPATPTLIVAGALAASGALPITAIVALAVIASLLGDLPWYWAGRRFGGGVLRMLCRISLSPDSCVRRSEVHFERWGRRLLIVSKFVPGLSTIAPPLAGAMGLPLALFLPLDGIGSLLWAGVPVALGHYFAAQVDTILVALANAGTAALEFVAASLIAYILAKWWRRQSLLAALRMGRISVEELHRAMAVGKAPLVVDVRSMASRRRDGRVLPGALLADIDGVGRSLQGIPLDHELVIYCNCPNEASAASAAKLLMAKGYKHVRPMQGGLDAWTAAGYPVGRLPPQAGNPPPVLTIGREAPPARCRPRRPGAA